MLPSAGLRYIKRTIPLNWLSTEAARSEERIAWARDLQWERLSWEELCQSFGLR
jgi:hypothetical protein